MVFLINCMFLCWFYNFGCFVLRYLQKAFAPEYLSNWVLVAAAIAAGLIAYFTLRGIQSQVDSASKAADAAATSANAVVLSERAIVIARPEFPDQFPLWAEHKQFTWSVKNASDTPAIVLETQAVFEVVDQGSLAELPERPSYPQPINAKGMQLAKGDSYSFEVYLTDAQGHPLPITPGLRSSIGNKHQIVRCYGYVKYLDIFRQEHYSRFCHYFRVGSSPLESGFKWLLGAPSAYFEQT